MKKLILIVTSILILFSFTNFAEASIFTNGSTEIKICEGNECGLEQGVDLIENSGIDGVVTDGKASEYIQKIIVYVLTFLKLIAVIIIIYAGFNMLTAAGDDEKATSSKKMIVFAIIGLAIIYLAGPITTFVLDVFSQKP